MKKTATALILILAVLLCSCAAAGSKTDMVELRGDMISSAGKLPAMLSVSSESDDAGELFGSLSDVDYQKVGSFFLDYAADGSAYEIAVIEARQEADVREFEKSLNAHLDSRVKLYKAYDPKQASKAQKALVVTNGRLIALIMCDQNSDVKAAFMKAGS